MLKLKKHQRMLLWGLIGLLTASLVILGSVPGLPTFVNSVSYAQSNNRNIQTSYVSAEQIALRFYQRVPNFPRADNYKVTNPQIKIPSTLVERLALYHTLVKGRSPQRRFDWKLTLADFLGLNDVISAQSYPGREYLDKNPLEDDRVTIRQLNRQQRNQLVQTLVDLYTPAVARETAPATPGTPDKPQATPTLQPFPATAPSPSRVPPSPQGGGAQLLTPPAPAVETPPRPTGDARLLLP
jgi:hypothetical protein